MELKITNDGDRSQKPRSTSTTTQPKRVPPDEPRAHAKSAPPPHPLPPTKLSGRQTWEKPAKKRVTFDLKRSESLDSSSNSSSSSSNNNDINSNREQPKDDQVKQRNPQNIRPERSNEPPEDISGWRFGDSGAAVAADPAGRDEERRRASLEPAGSSPVPSDSESASRRNSHLARIGMPCRSDHVTSGYSPVKTHRRKASLGTKDFAVVFPDLVTDNFEYRCRVVV